MQQRTCLWRLLAALLAVSLAIGYSVNEYYFSHSWNETVDHDGIERESVLKRVTLGAELNRGFRKAEIVDGEAAGGGNRLGGEHERPEGGALSLNGDDEAGDAPGDVGFGAGLGAGGEVTSHGNLRGSSDVKKALLLGPVDQGSDAVVTAALVSPEGQKTRQVWFQPAASSVVIVGDGLDRPTNMETDGEYEDVDVDVYEGDGGLQDPAVEEEHPVEAVNGLPSWHSWHAGGAGQAIASGRQWTDEVLREAARKQAVRAVPLLAILLLDPEIVAMRALFMAETHNGHRTQALLCTCSLSRVMYMIYFLASIGDERGIEAWGLMTAIVDAIEATGLTSMSRTRILQGVLTIVLTENARGTLVPAHISQPESDQLADAVCALLLLAQCSYAAEAANMLATATFHDLDRFWEQMRLHSNGRQVAKGFKPMYEQEFRRTGVCMVIIASPTSRQVVDVDGRSVPTRVIVLMVCAVEATFYELRVHMSTARVAASDVHKCYEAMRIMHEGLDGTPTGVFEDFALALGRQANSIASAFGLHKPVPPPPTPQPPTPQPPTATPWPSSAPTPAPTYTAYNTNWGTRQHFVVVPCDSPDFEEVQDAAVGFYKLVKLICPEDANPDHVRQAIYRLFRSGANFGDTRLAALLFKTCGAGRWVPGPTYEAEPEFRA